MSEKQKKIELKPCPFCGGEVEIKQTGSLKILIRCKSCLFGRVQKVLRNSIDWLIDKQIEAWNKRTYTLTVDQRDKVIRLCDWVEAQGIELNCGVPDFNCHFQCTNCIRSIAKQLLEELQTNKKMKCHFCDNEAVKTNDVPMCQDCIDDTVY